MEVRELDNDIKSGKLKQLYFFYGPEVFLLENKISSIKRRVVAKGLEEFGYSKLSGREAKTEDFENEFYSYPMAGEKKLIVLKNTGWFSNSKSSEFLSIKRLFSDIPEYLYIVVREDSFEKKKEKNLDFIKEQGGIVNFEHLPVNQLCTWIEKMFSDSGKQVKQADILYIANACSCEMSKIYSEVNKLIVFSNDNDRIASDDIRTLVTKTGEYKIYELFDDIVEARGKQAAEKLKQILDSKERPTAVIAGITNRFSELLTIKLLYSDRVLLAEIKEYLEFKLPDFAVKKMLAQSKKYGEKYLKRIIRMGISLDRSIKSGKIDQTLAAEMFVSELIRKE